MDELRAVGIALTDDPAVDIDRVAIGVTGVVPDEAVPASDPEAEAPQGFDLLHDRVERVVAAGLNEEADVVVMTTVP